MRPGQNKRSRGRNGGGPQHFNNNRPRLPHRVQTFDSNGPSVKIRGNAYQVFERYVALAREAQASGDRVAAENHFRVMNAMGEGQGQGPMRPTTPADLEMTGGDGEAREGEEAQGQATVQHAQVQPQPPSPSPGSHADFTRQIDEASRGQDHPDDEQPPS